MAEKTVQAVCRVLKRRPRPSTSDEALKTPPLAAPRVSVLRNPPRLTASRAFLGRESPCNPRPQGSPGFAGGCRLIPAIAPSLPTHVQGRQPVSRKIFCLSRGSATRVKLSTGQSPLGHSSASNVVLFNVVLL